MLAALIERATPDCTVLRAVCWDGKGVPPLWPWSQILQASDRSITALGDAGRLLTSGSSSLTGMDAGAAADEQFRVFESVAGALAGLAAERPAPGGP